MSKSILQYLFMAAIFVLAFNGCETQDNLVDSVRLPGTEVMVRDGRQNLYPSWHPQKDAIVYISADVNSKPVQGFVQGTAIRQTNLTSDSVQTLWSGSEMLTFCDVHPGGNLITLCRHNGSDRDVVIFNPEKITWQTISRLDGDELFPQWSPDGNALAFLHDKKISIYHTQSLNTETIDLSVSAHSFCWHPTGDGWLLFGYDGTEMRLYRYRWSHNELIALSNQGLNGSWPAATQPPQFAESVLGPHMIYSSGKSLRLYDLDAAQAAVVVPQGTFPAWSWQGDRIAYSFDGQIRIEAMWVKME
jgi:Tol biopolymer transport system component